MSKCDYVFIIMSVILFLMPYYVYIGLSRMLCVCHILY